MCAERSLPELLRLRVVNVTMPSQQQIYRDRPDDPIYGHGPGPHGALQQQHAKQQDRLGSGLGDSTATGLAAMTIEHFTHQLETIDRAIGETIDRDAASRGRRDLLLSVSGVGETLAALLLVEMPSPDVLRRSGEMVAYAGLNPSHHRSGSSIDRPTRISKIGNATLRSSLYMPALSAMRFNPAVAALVARLKEAGRLKPKQIVVAAMRKLLVGIVTLTTRRRSSSGSDRSAHTLCGALGTRLLVPDLKFVGPDCSVGTGGKTMAAGMEVIVDECVS